MKKTRRSFYAVYIKRLLDIICSLVMLAILCPLYGVVALLVRIKIGKPVLFRQERTGKIDAATGKEKIFTLYKFRTMTNERDTYGELLPDSDRITPFGSWLRRTSIDEFPQAVNILKGDMSFIGPRPLLVKYIDRYTEEQHHRHDVRPGLSGYAQVHGRNSVSWEDKFAMDVWYAENVSFINDVKITIETVKTILRREGINSGTSATMEEFLGQAGK